MKNKYKNVVDLFFLLTLHRSNIYSYKTYNEKVNNIYHNDCHHAHVMQ